MIGKFFVFALFCVALSKAQEEDVQVAIEKALLRLKDLDFGVNGATDGTFKQVAAKRELIKMKSSIYAKEKGIKETKIIESLERVASEMERKATEMHKPNSTFECITKAKTQAVTGVRALGPKFDSDLKKLEQTKLTAIDAAAKPLPGIKNSLPGKYNRAVSTVKKCKTTECVNSTMEKLEKEYSQIFAELKVIYRTIGDLAGEFIGEGSRLLGIYSRQANILQEEGIRAMKSCVFRFFK